jgi:hypothetical protein
MNILPYIGIDNLRFGSTASEAISKFGNPTNKRLTSDKEKEYHYDGFIIRFDSEENRFRELTLLPGCQANLDGEAICWDVGYFSKLLAKDGEPKEVFGFILLLNLGIAMSGFHEDDESEKTIHFFRKGDWDEFGSSMKDFFF